MGNLFINIVSSLVLFILLNSSASGQLLNNQLGEAFTDRPFFNEDLVEQNGIKSITGKFSHYKLGDAMRETELYRAYHFDEKGRLSEQYESRKSAQGTDTLVSIYEYDDDGNLTAMRQRDQYGFYAYIYEYDSAGRVIREEYRRNLTRDRQSATNFRLGKEFVVTYETASYQNFDGQEKKTIYNSYGIPYKDIMTYYNDQGQIILKEERLRRTSKGTTTTYSYNELGLLDSLKTVSDISARQERLYVFEYNEYNNLFKKNYYKNGVHTTQHRVLYDDKTMTLETILIQNIATDFIRILKMEDYIFYED